MKNRKEEKGQEQTEQQDYDDVEKKKKYGRSGRRIKITRLGKRRRIWILAIFTRC